MNDMDEVQAIVERVVATLLETLLPMLLKTATLLTEAEAAEAANVSPQTIRRCIREGRLVASDYGSGSKHLWRIERSALAALEPAAAEQVIPTSRRQRRAATRRAAGSLDDYMPRVHPPAAASAFLPRVLKGTKPFSSPLS
jgi:hypothetical protein